MALQSCVHNTRVSQLGSISTKKRGCSAMVEQHLNTPSHYTIVLIGVDNRINKGIISQNREKGGFTKE